ncbi:hypothetical protein ACJX0J_030121, partial [Zea mays]
MKLGILAVPNNWHTNIDHASAAQAAEFISLKAMDMVFNYKIWQAYVSKMKATYNLPIGYRLSDLSALEVNTHSCAFLDGIDDHNYGAHKKIQETFSTC